MKFFPTQILLLVFIFVNALATAQCDLSTVEHFNLDDFPATLSSGITVDLSGENAGEAGPYDAPCGSVEALSITLYPNDYAIFTFSAPVESVVFQMAAMNMTENGHVTSNAGDCIVTTDCTESMTTTDNYFERNLGTINYDNPVIYVSIPGGATEVTVTCNPSNSTGAWTIDLLDCTDCPATTNSITETSCDSYTAPSGTVYEESGIYTDIIPNSMGCDSVITIDLTINDYPLGTDYQVACDSLQWMDGNTYFEDNNTATYFKPNPFGCDSLITLDLVMNYAISAIDEQTACDSFTWIDDSTYTASTDAPTHLLSTMAGCDSLVTLDLTVNYSTAATDSHTECGSFEWIDGNVYFESNNTATYLLENAVGCDSLVTLDLTINYPTTGIDTQTACDSFEWIDGNTYTENNNTATYLLENALGCDSLVTLNLVINTANAAVSENAPTLTADTQNASYQWLDCNDNLTPIMGETQQSFTAQETGSYAVEVEENGCTAISDCFDITIVGLNETSLLGDLVIYPNPMQNQLFIELAQPQESVQVKVLTSAGQVILEQTFENTEKIELQLDEAPGMYFVEVGTNSIDQVIFRVLKK